MESRFFSTFSRITWVLQVLGTYPLKHVKQETQVSLNLFVYSFFLNTFFFFGAIKILPKWSERFILNRIIYSLNFTSFFFLIVIFSYRMVKHYKRMENILRSIDSAERRLSKLGTYFQYGAPPFNKTIITIVFWITTIAMKCICKGFKSHLKRFLNYYSELLHTVNLLNLLSILQGVEVLFFNASEQLRWIFCNPTNIKKKIETLEILVEIHEDLCALCCKIEKLYSIQLLLTVSASFLNFTANMYFLMFQKTFCRAFMSFSAALVGLMHCVTVCSATASISGRVRINFFYL